MLRIQIKDLRNQRSRKTYNHYIGSACARSVARFYLENRWRTHSMTYARDLVSISFLNKFSSFSGDTHIGVCLYWDYTVRLMYKNTHLVPYNPEAVFVVIGKLYDNLLKIVKIKEGL